MPSNQVQFLSLDEVLAIHQALIDRFGGANGLIDPGLLESALFRPKTGYYKDIVEMAAALFESLINNHPFVYDNKRVAFFTTDVFLRLNGFKLEIKSEDAYEHLMNLFEERNLDLRHLDVWIREHLQKLE